MLLEPKNPSPPVVQGLDLDWDGSAATTMTLKLKEDDCAFLKSIQAQMNPQAVRMKVQ